MALADRIAELMLQQGNVQANALNTVGAAQAQAAERIGQIQGQAQQRQGEIWGQTLQSLGQIPLQVYGQIRQQKADAQTALYRQAQMADLASQARERDAIAAERAQKTRDQAAIDAAMQTGAPSAGANPVSGGAVPTTDDAGVPMPTGGVSPAPSPDATSPAPDASQGMPPTGAAPAAPSTVRDRTIAALKAAGNGHLVPAITKTFDDADAAATKAQEARMKGALADIEYGGHLALGIKASGYSPAAVQIALADAQEHGYNVSHLQGLVQHPEQIQPLADQMIATAQKVSEPGDEVKVVGNNLVDKKGNVLFSADPKAPPPPAPGSFADYVTRYAQSKNKSLDPQAPNALTTADIEDARKRYQQADDKAPKPPAPTAPVELTPAQNVVASKLASGDLTFQQFGRLVAYSRDPNMKMALYAKASDLNPEFSPANFELGYKMASNPAIRQRIVAINQLNPVVNKIEELADQVGNGDVQAWNKVLNSAKLQFGNQTVTNFRQLTTLLGDEAGNALGVASGSDLKTKLGLDLVNPNLSSANFRSTMEQLRDTLNSRRTDLYTQMGIYGTKLQEQNPPPGAPPPAGSAPKAPAGWKYVAKPGGGWTAVEDK